jgi:pilus assembly protein CpaF
LKRLFARFVRQSPAMIVAMIALFVALSGTAVATTSALITGAQIKNGSITGLDIKNKSVTALDIKGQLRGARGAAGAPGPVGPAGAEVDGPPPVGPSTDGAPVGHGAVDVGYRHDTDGSSDSGPGGAAPGSAVPPVGGSTRAGNRTAHDAVPDPAGFGTEQTGGGGPTAHNPGGPIRPGSQATGHDSGGGHEGVLPGDGLSGPDRHGVAGNGHPDNRDPARQAAPVPAEDPVARYGQVDERLVDRLHDLSGRRLTRRITELQGDDTHLPYEDERALGRQVIYEVLAEWRAAAYETGRRPLPTEVEERLAREVHNRLYGLGALQPLIDDPEVVDIHIGGHNNVWLHRADGTKVRGPKAAPSDAALIDMISRQARRMGRSERRWDREEVSLDLQLPDGSRLHALREVTGRPVIDIRCHDFVQFERLSDLEDRHVMDRGIHDFLSVAVRCGLNVILAGGKGMGKTTTLRCLLNEVPPDERIITVEDSLELGIERFPDLHPDVESIEARPPNSEGHGEFTLAEAVRQGLRMRGRIIVGEVRGDEVIPMLKAMSAGEDGSMCTIHAMSSANVFDRLAMYAAMSDGQGFQPEVTAMLVANAVHFVVYLGWDNGTPSLRRVQSIREVVGADGNQVISNEVWAPDRLGRAVPASRLRERTEQLLADNGYDLRLRDNPQGWWQR